METIPKGVEALLGVITLLQPHERVLVITDDKKLEIGQTMYHWARQRFETTLAVMTPRRAHGAEPTDTIAAAMRHADVIFVATAMSLFHSAARRAATSAGCRYVNLVDYVPEMFETGGLTADFQVITETLDRLREVFWGESLTLTAPGGTCFTCGVKGRSPVVDYGRSTRPGQASSPPNAEIALGPVEGTSSGVLVIDGSIPHPRLNLIREPIRLTVEDGLITRIEGGEEADILREILEDYHDARVYNIGEVGLPVNEKNELCGRMLPDEGAYGTVHIGIGNSLSFGGTVDAPVHLDMVIRRITCAIDGRVISRGGILQVR